jgi:hypothetical protein
LNERKNLSGEKGEIMKSPSLRIIEAHKLKVESELGVRLNSMPNGSILLVAFSLEDVEEQDAVNIAINISV